MINHMPLMRGQGLYVVDYVDQKISFQKGIEDLLGYSPEEYTIELITNSYHPEEEDRIGAIVKSALEFGFNNPVSMVECKLFVTNRVRCKSGKYKWLLRQSAPLETSRNGFMISNVNLITDIDFMKPEKISWLMTGDNIDQDAFNKKVLSAYCDLFTQRELEILDLLIRRMSSKEIADQLFVSKNTVDTHRRNMLKKVGLKNSIELIEFVKRYQINEL